MKQRAKNPQHGTAINVIRWCVTIAGIAAIASASAWQLPQPTQESQNPPPHPVEWKTSALTFDKGRVINVHNTIVLNKEQPDLITDTVVITGLDVPMALGRVAGRDDNIQHLPVALPHHAIDRVGSDYTITRSETADGTPRVVIALNRIHFRPTDVNGGFEIGVFDTTDPNAWVPITNGAAGGDTLRVQYANALPQVSFSRTGVVFRGGDLETDIENTRELDDGVVTITVRGINSNLQLGRVVNGDNNIDPGVDVQPRIHYRTEVGRNSTTFTLRRVVFRPTDSNGGFSIGVFDTSTKPYWTQITNGPSYGKDSFRVSFRGVKGWAACIPAKALSNSEKAAFFNAASSGNVQEVRRYLSPCVRDIDATDAQGHTALILAAARNHVEVVELLIAAGANLEIKDKQFRATALIHALNRGDSHIDTVRLLLNADANVNVNVLPLRRAAESGHVAIVKAILATGRANINAHVNGNTALHLATRNGHVEVARMLVNAGADPDLRDKGGNTALMLATKQGDLGTMRVLIDAGADPDIPSYDKFEKKYYNRHGVTYTRGNLITRGVYPIQWAAYYNNVEAIDLLGIKKPGGAGANLEATDKDGNTAFIWAANRGHVKALKYLRTLGANIKHRNVINHTAHHVAPKVSVRAYLFGIGVPCDGYC